MTGNNYNNLNEKNEQILSDIANLQQMERDMYTQLISPNNNLTINQKEMLIQKINQISQMRINLYKTLTNVNSFYQTNLLGASDTLSQQTKALRIVEEQLNEAKQRMDYINGQKVNRMRQVEINNYYSAWYDERVALMKVIVYIILALIIVLIMKKYIPFPVPSIIYSILFIIIALIGLYFIIPIVFSMYYRNNVIYSEYDWAFNKNKAPVISANNNSKKNNPWVNNPVDTSKTCIGEQCCPSGLSFDVTANKCSIGAYNSNSTGTVTVTDTITDTVNGLLSNTGTLVESAMPSDTTGSNLFQNTLSSYF